MGATSRAVELANGDAVILGQCGLTLANNLGEYEEGLAIIDLAVASNPNNGTVMHIASVVHLHCGDLRRALEYGHRAVGLHPGRAGAFLPLTGIAHAHIALGQFEEALGWAERSLAANHDFEATYWMLIAANAKLGRFDEARRWTQRLLALRPATTIALARASPGATPIATPISSKAWQPPACPTVDWAHNHVPR